MRYQTLSSEFYQRNRKKFIENLDTNSFSVFHSNDVMPTNADGTMGFRQNNDFFYLTGIDQEESALLLDFLGNEILFVRETSENIKIWEGEKLSSIQATELSGISEIRWYKEYEAEVLNWSKRYKKIYLSNNEHSRAESDVETRNTRLGNALLKQVDSELEVLSSAKIMHLLRYQKDSEEVKQLRVACHITQKAFERTLTFLKPDVYEYEIEAEIIHEFIKNGSRGHAYHPIIASGKNACVLHYVSNNNLCKNGELVLMDFGAEYGNYNADCTRTIPVNGRFSERQKEVYNAVLDVHNFAKDILIAGNTFELLNKEVGLFMQSELIKLGLIDKTDVKNQDPKNPLFRKYFMHGTAHSLGLDVHDVDDRSIPFAEGMVFTCEPGIYIPEEQMGIRLENNFYLTKDANIDLMARIPIAIEEIEDKMNS